MDFVIMNGSYCFSEWLAVVEEIFIALAKVVQSGFTIR
jgi:hypothetical protein